MMMRAALRRHHARARLQQRIEARLMVIGAAVAERVDRHVDEAGIRFRERVVIEAEALHATRAEIFHDQVGLFREAVDDVEALTIVEVDRKAALALVPSEKTQTETAKGVAIQIFDFDYLGAELRENHRTVRSRNVAGEIEHRDSIEWTFREVMVLGHRNNLRRVVEIRVMTRVRCRRRRSHGFAGRRSKGDGYAELHRSAEVGIADFLAHPDGGGLPIRDELLARHHRRAGYIGIAQNLEPMV